MLNPYIQCILNVVYIHFFLNVLTVLTFEKHYRYFFIIFSTFSLTLQLISTCQVRESIHDNALHHILYRQRANLLLCYPDGCGVPHCKPQLPFLMFCVWSDWGATSWPCQQFEQEVITLWQCYQVDIQPEAW